MTLTETNTDRTLELADLARAALAAVGAELPPGAGATARTPITGATLFEYGAASAADVDAAIERAYDAFLVWRTTPAPVRGALVKRFAELLTEHKDHLADLVGIEVGKIRSEALGEIQEMIDICDLAVGLSRQLYGVTMPSERPGHRLMEQWHPLGVVGVISAFNFPAAVWSWNTALALVCGDPVVWKPSPNAGLTAMACNAVLLQAARDVGAPEHLGQVVVADADAGGALLRHPRVALVSATGSERMGAAIAPIVAGRFGRLVLELGGNNACVVAPTADLDLAVRGITFAAAGTAGQRCTTMRRVIAHHSIVDELVARLAEVYGRLSIGDPFEPGTLVGPVIGESAWQAMQAAIAEAVADGGEVVSGGTRREVDGLGGVYVEPAIVRMPSQTAVVRRETFAPIIYLMSYETIEEAVAIQNGVPQGLSSSIFTLDQREAEFFVSAAGSDCGIANVNIGTSGAEIGGAFGGEKSTGGGRESGSDAWRNYMRRATNTINYSHELPLAQGVNFG